MTDTKLLARNPSFTPSPALRQELQRHHGGLGTTGRLNQLWDRYQQLIRADALPLTTAERQVLGNVLSGSFIDPGFIAALEQEVADSDDYQGGSEAAVTLLAKVESASYGQRLATVELMGF